MFVFVSCCGPTHLLWLIQSLHVTVLFVLLLYLFYQVQLCFFSRSFTLPFCFRGFVCLLLATSSRCKYKSLSWSPKCQNVACLFHCRRQYKPASLWDCDKAQQIPRVWIKISCSSAEQAVVQDKLWKSVCLLYLLQLSTYERLTPLQRYVIISFPINFPFRQHYLHYVLYITKFFFQLSCGSKLPSKFQACRSDRSDTHPF